MGNLDEKEDMSNSLQIMMIGKPNEKPHLTISHKVFEIWKFFGTKDYNLMQLSHNYLIVYVKSEQNSKPEYVIFGKPFSGKLLIVRSDFEYYYGRIYTRKTHNLHDRDFKYVMKNIQFNSISQNEETILENE